ncbi:MULTISPECIES: DUF7519 family protein [Haloferax]|uniref:Uncharacterized protein n=1 Tax=Haloferax massiliensis TaxID=1476858 RepID=A0A0D6JVK5_9EURY|nr:MULTISPECIES: hypothetical protein [Haloferax]MDS0242216.1 hypothetical protein [Haloferax sp. S2CR25]MDS0445337.1 hypothetical protein [Haloferax sp. S2CR25-2]CQR52975.1 hypothetical protein BN996_03396 [Haloferax massiliensis]
MSGAGAVTRRPARLSAALSLFAAALSVSVVVSGASAGLFAAVAGLVITSEGAHRFRTGRQLLGVLGLLVGVLVAVGGAGAAAASAAGRPQLIETGLGILGVFCLGLGVLPLRGAGSRGLCKLGCASVLLTVVAGGLFQTAGLLALLVSCAALVVSWDAAENSISVGEQLGRESRTWTIEAAHFGGSALVGGVAVGAGLVVRDLGTPGLPLHAVAFMLVALVFLTLALHD